MSAKNFSEKPKTNKEIKWYTASKEGYTFKSSCELSKKVMGVSLERFIDKLLKKIMFFYPYEYNSVRIDPHKSSSNVIISFPIINDCKITNRDYPSFKFVCHEGKITRMIYEKGKYDLTCVAERFNYDEIFVPLLKNAGIEVSGEVETDVKVCRDYKVKEIVKRKAESYQKLFDDYVTANDRLKYINGSYYEWASPEVSLAYKTFIDNYEGNYYLDNAVRRGCIID